MFGKDKAQNGPVVNDRDLAVQLSKDLIAAVEGARDEVSGLRSTVQALVVAVDEVDTTLKSMDTDGKHKRAGSSTDIKVNVVTTTEQALESLTQAMDAIAQIPNRKAYNMGYDPR